jgi:hypothetical protein
MGGSGEVKQVTGPFQLEVNYAYTLEGNRITEYFLIDVVSYDHLSVFLSTLESSDVESVFKKVRWDQRERPRY